MHTRPSSTVRSSTPASRTSGKVTSPARRTAAPSTNVSSSGSATGPPAASAAAMLAAPAGSTPTTRTAGCARAQPARDARDQPAAADRHHDDVGRPAQLRDDLHADGALARDRAEVVEGGHDRRPGVLGVPRCGRRGVVVGVALDDELHPFAAERADPLALLPRRRGGHVDPAAHAEAAARVRHALAVVARARAHGPGGALGGVEAGRSGCRRRAACRSGRSAGPRA